MQPDRAQDGAREPGPTLAALDRAIPSPAASHRAGQSGPTRPSFGGAPRPEGEKPLASPAVRLRAREAGIDLRRVHGTGPANRITHEDLDAFLAQDADVPGASAYQVKTAVRDMKVAGLRRRIAERMTVAHTRIPHITYVEEIDVTALETLRATLNDRKRADQPRLTLLPFLMRAVVRAVAEQPDLNALYDDDAGVVHIHAGVHIGIATQTPSGLMVPVVRHVEALDLWSSAAAMIRVAEAARAGTATRDELSGSTITITSLGAMGGLVSTPIINHPEVAIIGVNKIVTRPVWDGAAFIPRKMMNLSSSFDHRIVDGWDAARFIQRIRALLETPALIFVDG
jgi:2-oxoisovalerate dehydrogenase E2 component (dihydrolipoyl transacylase)